MYYRALAGNGKIQTGTLSTEDDRAAARELRRLGLTPVFIGTAKPSGFSFQMPRFGGRGARDVLHFTQEIATLLNAGIPLDRALSITSELTERPQFQAVLSDVSQALRSGKSFADSLGNSGAGKKRRRRGRLVRDGRGQGQHQPVPRIR